MDFLPILILLAVVTFVLSRLPKIDLKHSSAFKKRRVMNWLPLGLTYAFLYMGRYNLTVSKSAFGDLMTKSDFGTIFFWGTIVYGTAFVLNGPLTDKFGGRIAMLVATAGSSLMNIAMGYVAQSGFHNGVVVFSVLYALNMYFQSFGAVAIVKVNAHWFHVRERGTFGGIFGILISLGVYFAFDWCAAILKAYSLPWVFYGPACILLIFLVIDFFLVKDTPGHAGHKDFETGDASWSVGEKNPPVLQIAKKMLSNPIILTIVAIEFCSGFLRNTMMHWYIIFANETGIKDSFVPKNWGLLLCCAGILGGVFAGTLSDRIFQSRRGPVSAVLYAGMVLGGTILVTILKTSMVGWLMVVMSMCIIGVHGMLSGTASMDFGGKKNAGIAVGLIDGFVYLGTAFESILFGIILPKGALSKDPAQWILWPIAMLPMAVIGLYFCMKIWNAKPKASS